MKFDVKKNNLLRGKEVIIFDLDGTLIDSVNMHNEIYATLVKNTAGKIIHPDQIQDDWDEFIHTNKEDVHDGFLIFLNEKYNNGRYDLAEMKSLHKKIESDYIENRVGYKEYAKEVLELLKEKSFKLVLATISPRSILDIYNAKNKKMTSEFRLYDYFDLVLSYDDVKNRKPDPEVYLTALNKMDTQNYKCLIIEDSLEGVKAANSARIEVLNIVDKNMYNTQEQIDRLSTYKMNSLKEFYDLLENDGGE